MKKLTHILNAHSLSIVVLGYFIFTLTNLTLLPIFNDESIYLDWGWLSLHAPGNLYLSLLDAKQPLLIWLFGIFVSIFSDPLFAGRCLSVLVGSLSVVGMFFLTKKLSDKQTALFAAVLYAIIPIFVFFERQALMESSVACVGIWSGWALLRLLQKPSVRNGVVLGIILGIGFLIKSSVLLFVVSAILLIGFYFLRAKKKALLLGFLFACVSFVFVDLIIFLNPLFWQTFSTNSRYSYTLSELFAFPLSSWIENVSGFFQIGFLFLSPFVFLAALFGIFLLVRAKRKDALIMLSYFCIALLLELLSVKSQSQRYLVSFLPFFSIPAAYVFRMLWNGSVLEKLLVGVAFIVPLLSSCLLIFSPQAYILQSTKLTKYANAEYLFGQTAGYGVQEVMQYIQGHSTLTQPTMVLTALYTGNPENAIAVYSYKSAQLYPLWIDATFFPDLASYACMTSDYPLFFVTRNDMRVGVEKYFVLEKSFPTLDNNYAVKIYTLRKDCEGKSLSLSTAYGPMMSKILEMRRGY